MDPRHIDQLNKGMVQLITQFDRHVERNEPLTLQPAEIKILSDALKFYAVAMDEKVKEEHELVKLTQMAAVATGGDWTYEMDHSHQATVYAGRQGFGINPETQEMTYPTHGLNLFGRLELDRNGENNLRFMTEAVRYVKRLATERLFVRG